MIDFLKKMKESRYPTYAIIVSFFYVISTLSVNLFKYDNDCGDQYLEVRKYKYIAGKIIHVQNNDTISRLGINLDKYKTKCLTCMNGDSIVYVKFKTLFYRYDIVKGDSLFVYSDSKIFSISIYRNGQLRPKLNLY